MRFLTENYRGLCFECWFYVGQNSGNVHWSESEKNMKEEVRHENLERILNCPSPGTSIGTLFNQIQGLPWWLKRWRSRLQCRRPRFDPWVGKIPWRRQWLSTPVFLPGESHRQRSLAGYSLWGQKESDTVEWLTHTHTPHISPILLNSLQRQSSLCFILGVGPLKWTTGFHSVI